MNQSPKGPFCQSCSMPMQKPSDFGTDANSSRNEEYCCYCYQKGAFTEPNITMDQMIDKVAKFMSEMQPGMSEDHATEICVNFIPRLKRWRK